MDESAAVKAMTSLGHEVRMQAFRLLMRNIPHGLRAGELSHALKISPPSLSFHMAALKNGGLVQSRRSHRSIISSASLQQMQSMLRFLINDCCDGNPEVCGFVSQTKTHLSPRK